MLSNYFRSLGNRAALSIFKLQNREKDKFECPVCGYYGPFIDVTTSIGPRKHSKCPNCKALEKHRIQFIIVNEILKKLNTNEMKMLLLPPDHFFHDFFSKRFGKCESSNMNIGGVDYQIALQQLPFEDASYDFVFASHALEHVPDDEKAISEIRRILKPKGMAVLPVPIIAEKTIEYPEPNPYETYHVRAPGLDYFNKYERYFSKVERFSSDSLPLKYQLFIFEDRSKLPYERMPLRPSMHGDKHVNIVPVCYV